MFRVRQVTRAEFFAPLSFAWWVTTALFLGAMFLGYWFSQTQGGNLTVCPMRLAFGIPCPLCGGTRAAMSLLSGNPLAALRMNPLATVAVPAFAAWTLLWLGFSRKLETTLSAPRVTALILLILAVNWAYILSRHH